MSTDDLTASGDITASGWRKIAAMSREQLEMEVIQLRGENSNLRRHLYHHRDKLRAARSAIEAVCAILNISPNIGVSDPTDDAEGLPPRLRR